MRFSPPPKKKNINNGTRASYMVLAWWGFEFGQFTQQVGAQSRMQRAPSGRKLRARTGFRRPPPARLFVSDCFRYQVGYVLRDKSFA